MKLNDYMNDGANYQAQCVLACLRNNTIEESYNAEHSEYDAQIDIGRWENCREQGYVAMLYIGGHQLNIAWFEHRNSDGICALEWEQTTINAPTIDTAEFGNVYKDKWDVSKSVGCYEFIKMRDWIMERFTEHYLKYCKKPAVAS